MYAILNGEQYSVTDLSSDSEVYLVGMSATDLVNLYLKTYGKISHLIIYSDEDGESEYNNLDCWGFQMLDGLGGLLFRDYQEDIAVLMDKARAYDILVGEDK